MALRALSLAALAALLLPGDSTDLYFEPEAGTVLERTVELFASFDLDDAEVTVMGQTVGPEAMGRDLASASAEGSLRFEQTDTYASSERGRALALVRRLGLATFNGESLPEEGPREVEFNWDASLGRHIASLPEGAAEDPEDPMIQRVLAVMRADVDAGFLLPEGPVEPGATWTVELGPQELLDLLLPGLDLEQATQLARELAEEEFEKAPSGDQEQIQIARRLTEDLAAQLRSSFRPIEAEVTFSGFEAQDGDSLAKLDFRFDVDFSFDPAATILAALEGSEEAPQLSDFRLELALSAELSGTLLWDAQRHHSRGLRLNGDYSVDISGSAQVENEEMGEMPFSGLVSFSGALESSHTSKGPAKPDPAQPALPAGG